MNCHSRAMYTAFILTAALAGCTQMPSVAQAPCSTPVGTAQAADEKHSVFGIALGQPLAVPECQKSASFNADYSPSIQTVCYKRLSDRASCQTPQTGWVQIDFPFMTLPHWTSGSRMFALLASGRVEAVQIFTNGVPGQKSALGALTEKYGSPTSTVILDVENDAGPPYQSLNESWTHEDVSLILRGTDGRPDLGVIQIATPAGQDIMQTDTTKLREDEIPF